LGTLAGILFGVLGMAWLWRLLATAVVVDWYTFSSRTMPYTTAKAWEAFFVPGSWSFISVVFAILVMASSYPRLTVRLTDSIVVRGVALAIAGFLVAAIFIASVIAPSPVWTRGVP
jgi:hypothetical protein